MKNLRTLALAASIAALLGLGGCASFTPKDMLAQFELGEQPLYAVVAGKPRKMSELSDYADFQKNCGRQNHGEIAAPSFNEWLEKNVCGDMSPDGQSKFPHPWPPQIPPGSAARL
jgi:hypothetical protein